MKLYGINYDEGVTISEICVKRTAEAYDSALYTNVCVCRDFGEAERIADLMNMDLCDGSRPVQFIQCKIPEKYKKAIDLIIDAGNEVIEEMLGCEITADIVENLDTELYAGLLDRKPSEKFRRTDYIHTLPENTRLLVMRLLGAKILNLTSHDYLKALDGRLSDIEELLGSTLVNLL